MVINGEYPNVFSCLKCGTKEKLKYFHVKSGGTLCSDCARGVPSFSMEESTLYTMQYIITSSIEKLYTFTVSEEVLENLEKILNEYMKNYIDRKFHSLQVLEENQGFAAGMMLEKDGR